MQGNKKRKKIFISGLIVLAMLVLCLAGPYTLPSMAASSKASKPAKPRIKTCKVFGANSIKVGWNKSKNAAKYKVQYKGKGASSYKTAKTFKAGKKNYTCTIKGLEYGKTYKVRILAVNGKSKAASKTKTVTTKVKTCGDSTGSNSDSGSGGGKSGSGSGGSNSGSGSGGGKSDTGSSNGKTDEGSAGGKAGSGSSGENGETEVDPL